MKKKGVPEKNPLSDLEIIVINNRTYQQHEDILRQAHELIGTSYPPNKVISYERARHELSDPTNEAYTWLVAKRNGKVVATVVYDVWHVPRSPIDEKLVADGRNHYTGLYYATAANKEYDSILKKMVHQAIQRAKLYSKQQGKNNVGILTDDLINHEVTGELVGKYGGSYLDELGVPTLKDIPPAQYERNFRTVGHQKLVAIPFGRKWTNSRTLRVVANWLEQGYNQKSPGEEGHKPLTKGDGFKQFGLYRNSVEYPETTRRLVEPKPIPFLR